MKPILFLPFTGQNGLWRCWLRPGFGVSPAKRQAKARPGSILLSSHGEIVKKHLNSDRLTRLYVKLVDPLQYMYRLPPFKSLR